MTKTRVSSILKPVEDSSLFSKFQVSFNSLIFTKYLFRTKLELDVIAEMSTDDAGGRKKKKKKRNRNSYICIATLIEVLSKGANSMSNHSKT
jgi:uncharacterized membrane protein